MFVDVICDHLNGIGRDISVYWNNDLSGTERKRLDSMPLHPANAFRISEKWNFTNSRSSEFPLSIFLLKRRRKMSNETRDTQSPCFYVWLPFLLTRRSSKDRIRISLSTLYNHILFLRVSPRRIYLTTPTQFWPPCFLKSPTETPPFASGPVEITQRG